VLIKYIQCGHLSLILNAAGICRSSLFRTFLYMMYKVKVYPRTGHRGREREEMYSSILSLTSALDGVG
jgi:hypothetical protein